MRTTGILLLFIVFICPHLPSFIYKIFRQANTLKQFFHVIGFLYEEGMLFIIANFVTYPIVVNLFWNGSFCDVCQFDCFAFFACN